MSLLSGARLGTRQEDPSVDAGVHALEQSHLCDAGRKNFDEPALRSRFDPKPAAAFEESQPIFGADSGLSGRLQVGDRVGFCEKSGRRRRVVGRPDYAAAGCRRLRIRLFQRRFCGLRGRRREPLCALFLHGHGLGVHLLGGFAVRDLFAVTELNLPGNRVLIEGGCSAAPVVRCLSASQKEQPSRSEELPHAA